MTNILSKARVSIKVSEPLFLSLSLSILSQTRASSRDQILSLSIFFHDMIPLPFFILESIICPVQLSLTKPNKA